MEKFKIKRLLAAVALSVISTGAVSAPEDKLAGVRAAIAAKFPSLTIRDIRLSPETGLAEVFVGNGLLYASLDARWFIAGTLIDVETGKSISQPRLEQLQRISFDSLPKDGAITIKRGKGTHKLAVFADPRCPHCKRYEAELSKLDDVEITLYVTPVLGPQSATLARDILCSADPAKAWEDLMLRGKEPQAVDANSNCKGKSQVDAITAYARGLGVLAAPTTFFADGSRAPGALNGETLRTRFAAAASAQPKAVQVAKSN